MGPKARFVAAEASSLLFLCAFCLAVVTFGMLNGDLNLTKTRKKKKKLARQMQLRINDSHAVTFKVNWRGIPYWAETCFDHVTSNEVSRACITVVCSVRDRMDSKII